MTTEIPATLRRQHAILWAREVFQNPRARFLDVETCGLEPDGGIVDLAILDGRGVIRLATLINPGRSIPPNVTAIHGITDADVADRPSWTEIFPLIQEALADATIITYNAAFDYAHVSAACQTRGLTLPDRPWLCAHRAYCDFIAKENPNNTRHKLDNAAKRFGILPGGHRAIGDAETCRAIVFAMASFTMIYSE